MEEFKGKQFTDPVYWDDLIFCTRMTLEARISALKTATNKLTLRHLSHVGPQGEG